MRCRLWIAGLLAVGLIGLAGCLYLANIHPVAVFTADPTTGTSPLRVYFDASDSDDPDGTIVAYLWDFDDGQSASSSIFPFSHDFEVQTPPATFRVMLTVFDDDDATDTASVDITVVAP